MEAVKHAKFCLPVVFVGRRKMQQPCCQALALQASFEQKVADCGSQQALTPPCGHAGGAISVDKCPNFAIADSFFANNTANIAGGAVYLSGIDGEGIPTNSNFTDNISPICADVGMADMFTFSATQCVD